MRLRKPTGEELFGAFLIYVGVGIIVGAAAGLEAWARASAGQENFTPIMLYVLMFQGCAIVPIIAGLIIYFGILVIRGEANF